MGLGGSSSGSPAGSSLAGFRAGAGWEEPLPTIAIEAAWLGAEQGESFRLKINRMKFR